MSLTKTSTIVRQYLQKVKRAGIPVLQAYIFGSQAKGTSHSGSDIDLCIISPYFGKDRQKERLLLMNLSDEQTDIIEPHPVSPIDFQRMSDPFLIEVKKTGIAI